MPQLHLIKADGTTDTFTLTAGEMLLGRERSCDLHLDFAGVSRRHLRLFTVMEDTFLEDLGSRNGTFVNGRLTRKCVLLDGDIVQIGEVEMSFERMAGNAARIAPADPDATTVIAPGQFGPRSRAAREIGRPVEGISPLAERTPLASAGPLRPPSDLPPEERSWWDRLKAWFGR